MKINPKIAKTPEDLQTLEFKKMKTLIKKELKRLEKYTSAEKPTQFILLGAHNYTDKAEMALPLFGKWKAKFKQYAKKEVIKDPMGAIGAAYSDGLDDSGKKIVRIQLVKGKGKNKLGKIERNLKKLIPQAGYKVIFGEMTEEELLKLEKTLADTPEIEEDEPKVNAPPTKTLKEDFKAVVAQYKLLEALGNDLSVLDDDAKVQFQLFAKGFRALYAQMRQKELGETASKQFKVLQAAYSKAENRVDQHIQELIPSPPEDHLGVGIIEDEVGKTIVDIDGLVA